MRQEIRGPHESLPPRRGVGQSAIKADVEDKRPAGRMLTAQRSPAALLLKSTKRTHEGTSAFMFAHKIFLRFRLSRFDDSAQSTGKLGPARNVALRIPRGPA